MMKNLGLNTIDMNFVHFNKALPSLQSVCIEALSKMDVYDDLLGHNHRFLSADDDSHGVFFMPFLPAGKDCCTASSSSSSVGSFVSMKSPPCKRKYGE